MAGAIPPVANSAARGALEALVAEPGFEALDALLTACLDGVLVVDVTGTPPGAAPLARTILSTDGRAVLPLFTSGRELKAAVPRSQHRRVQAAVMQGADALKLAAAGGAAAVQFDPGSHGQVVTVDHIIRALERREEESREGAAPTADEEYPEPDEENPERATAAAPRRDLHRGWSCVFFDLDGTITDSAPSIVARLARTLDALGLPVPSEEELLLWVGPPIMDSFRDRAGLDDEGQWRALQVYREFAHADGAGDGSAVYPGVAGVLERVHAAGVPLALATSKSESQANKVLANFGMAHLFAVITGASEDETRSAKAEVIAEAVRRLEEQGIDLSHPVMVGDREHDVLGAAAHGIPTILVEWGYGSPAEAEGALAVVHSTDQLRSLLLG